MTPIFATILPTGTCTIRRPGRRVFAPEAMAYIKDIRTSLDDTSGGGGLGPTPIPAGHDRPMLKKKDRPVGANTGPGARPGRTQTPKNRPAGRGFVRETWKTTA